MIANYLYSLPTYPPIVLKLGGKSAVPVPHLLSSAPSTNVSTPPFKKNP